MGNTSVGDISLPVTSRVKMPQVPTPSAVPTRTPTKKELKADTKTYYDRGLSYEKERSWGLAIENFREAIKLEPNNAEAHLHLGLVYQKEQRLFAASEEFNETIKVGPASEAARTARQKLAEVKSK